MHVHHVMASGARGGGADHLLGLLPALAQLGVDVSATVGNDGPLAERLQALGVTAERQEMMHRRLDGALGRRLLAGAKLRGAHLVHVHGTRAAASLSAQAGLLPWQLARPPALPVIYTAHGLAVRARRPQWLRLLAARGEALACRNKVAVLSVSRADLNYVVARGWAAPDRAYHVGNAVRPARFLAARRIREALAFRFRAQYKIPPAAPLVGTVARLVPQKDVLTLARAVGRLANVHLVVVGDGPDRARLAAHPLAQAGRLHLLGACDNVPEIMVALNLFALSSRWEGEPIVLLEAMAAGIPWVATRTAGAEEIWHDSDGAGVLVPLGQPRAMAEALARLLAAPHEAARLATLGQRAVASRNPEGQARRVLRIYQACTAPPGDTQVSAATAPPPLHAPAAEVITPSRSLGASP